MSTVARRAVAESLVSVLKWRATHQPDRLAYVFASDASGEVRLTYADLDVRARNIAASLGSIATPGDCALLLYPPGLDFLAAFVGCLYSGIVAIPLFAPRPNRDDSRLTAIVKDSGARLALSVTRVLPADISTLGSEWQGIDCLFTDRIQAGLEETWEEPSISPQDLAYLQYTSGSTSSPKGVMVTHGNLVYNCGVMQDCWELSEDSVSVSWLPHFHDMGLIEGLLNPLHVGYPTVFMPPAQFVARPIRWLQLISRFRATHSGAPNFAYDLCVQKVRPEQRSELDLSAWTLAYSGSEPVRPETLDRFAEFFAPCGFRRRSMSPGYGLAEATLMVSAIPKSAGPIVKDVDVAHLERGIVVPANGGKSRRLVGCGRVGGATQLAIVDPETLEVCAEGTVGEIWVAGPTVAVGYWRQPEKSRETFNAFIADTGEGPFLRTGDLGFLAGKDLFVSGRLKDLIIIRGANYYPHDIEAVAEKAHPALRAGCGVAFSVEVDGEECLVVANEIDRQYRSASEAELEGIAAAIRRAVYQEFDIEIYAVQLLKVGGVAKTSSGKLQRQACRSDFLSGRSAHLFESRLKGNMANQAEEGDLLRRQDLLAMNSVDRVYALEERICSLVAWILQLPIRQIDREEPLGTYGLDSLKGTQLITLLEESFGVTLSSTVIFNYPSVVGLTRYLTSLMELTIDGGEDSSREPIVQGAPKDESLAELLNQVERTSISEMQQMLANRRSRNVGE